MLGGRSIWEKSLQFLKLIFIIEQTPNLSVYLILMLFFYLHQEKKFLEDILIK
ncbi:Uncharacterised protein [Mycobacterium tuberculosis]|nr:Uncharacterised protein [Mycobacterium tuberculosis]